MALTTVPVELANLDGAVTVNESSADADFRVESNGNANMLFVDGGNDRIGIGTNSPTRQLTVENTLANSGGVIGLTSSDSSTSGTLGIIHYGNSTDSSLASINGIADGATDAGALLFKTEATGGSIEERMRITSSAHNHVAIGSSSVTDIAAQWATGAVLDIHDSGSSNTGSVILSNDLTTNDSGLGNLVWANRNNSNASGATNTAISSISASLTTSDSNSGDDSGGYLRFFTKPEAGSLSERMRITNAGRVGIGTTSPRGALDCVVDHAVGYVITAQNDGNNQNRYGIKIIVGTDDGSGTNYLLDFFDGDGTNVGSVTNAGGTVSYGAFTAHHPCVIPDEDNNEESTEPAYPYGTLLETTSLSYSKNSDDSDTERGIIYNVQKSSEAYSRKVLGAYGNSMNQGPEEETNKHQVLILGDGHILCNNEKGNISVGDGICTSSTAGIGMKADKMAMIIGIAQEDVTFSGSETKLVAVQYGLQQFTPWTD